jgi:hypothetical protein
VLFFVVIFSRHISNLNFREDTFLNANSYSTLTSLNYPHSLQNGLTSKAVNNFVWEGNGCISAMNALLPAVILRNSGVEVTDEIKSVIKGQIRIVGGSVLVPWTNRFG